VEKALETEKEQLKLMNSAMVKRELRVIELKKEINSLLRELGKEEKYSW